MKKIITIVTIVALLFAVGLVAKPLDGQPLAKTAATTAGQVTRTMSNISNWGYWVYYNGKTAQQPNGSSGGIYPRGTAGAIYQDGFIWGGKYGTSEEIRVGGQTYNIGTQPGRVITGGNYEDGTYEIASAADPLVRVYRIRTDYLSLNHAMLIADAAELNETSASSVTEAMTQDIMDQYALDWEEWPTAWGAPFYDLNDDGVYDPDIGETPGIAQADQVLWYVVNDYSATVTTSLYGSQPIGVELQTTLWAYNQAGVRLGQIIFRSNKLINKSNTTMTDVYVSMWADPDLGSAANDYAGCDTTLSMGYSYNGEATDADYDVFGLAPPAFGYDFFQGPMIASVGDTAISGLEYVLDHENLPMTSFGWFAAGSAIEDPELGDYVGTLEFYNLLRGFKPTEDVDAPSPWTLGNVAGAATTKFPLYGDPTIPGALEVDGTESYFTPGDRRMCLSSGPFTFAPGESQEVVVAILGGLGADNIGSVADLKLTDAVAQTLFNGLFLEVPKPPASPNVTVRPQENTLILEWGSDQESVAQVEETVVSGYVFEGYNVYQLPHATATKDQAIRLATFDIVNGIRMIYETRTPDEYEGSPVSVPIVYGSDSGIERFLTIDWDYIDGKPLYEGKTYYFAVTAYNQNLDPGRLSEQAQESSLIALAATLQESLPGTATVAPDMAIPTTHTVGISDGQIQLVVIDPVAVTGHDYEISFVFNTDSSETQWALTDLDLDTVAVTGQKVLGTLEDLEATTLVDGLGIRVSGPPVGINPNKHGDFYSTNYGPAYASYDDAYLAGWDFDGGRWISGRDKGWIGLWGGLGNGNQHLGTTLTSGLDYMDVKLYFAGDTVKGSVATMAEKMANSKLSSPDRWSKAVSIDGWGNWGTSLADIPIAAYDTESIPPRRLKIAFLEDTGTPGQNNIWDMGYNPVDSIYAAAGGYEYIYFLNDDYDATYTDYLPGGSSDDCFAWPVLYNISPVDRGGWYYVEEEFEIEIFASNVNVANQDVFAFSTADYAPETSDSLMTLALDKINVFPNPYYAYNELATTPYDQYVTFTHLPTTATIKIFNLAGVLVKTIEHVSGQFEKWTLANESDIPVGSGMYIAHIDMPDVVIDGVTGVQKILKVMIVQKKQILEYY